MYKVYFLKTDDETRLMAIFLDELRSLGRKFTVRTVDGDWEVSLEF